MYSLIKGMCEYIGSVHKDQRENAKLSKLLFLVGKCG